MEKTGRLVLALLLSLSLLLAVCLHADHAGEKNRHLARAARKTILKTLGVCFLALSPEYAGARNLTDGVYNPIPDVPAGYCHYQSCDIVSPPEVPGRLLYKVQIVKGGK
jgi:hypothetical protein